MSHLIASMRWLRLAPIAFLLPTTDSAPRPTRPSQSVEVDYNGSFTFARIRYGGGNGFRRGGSAWAHDYPLADRNLPSILAYVTTARPNLDASNVFTLEDPEIFRYPILYVSEPGFWTITDQGASNLRNHLLKGGFLILDDFENRQLDNALVQLRRALPEYQPIEIGPDHAIFDSFFRIDNIYIPHPLVDVTPVYYGLFVDNDPDSRMLAIINHNNDLAEYWEWSDAGYFPVDLTNEAYKIGVNYLIFSLTH
jgi:hypothetical protein